MARTLTTARVRVRPGAEVEYVQTVRALAKLAEARGRRLWLFRSNERSSTYLECSESGAIERHRIVAALPADERELEARLRELADYGEETHELWREVRF